MIGLPKTRLTDISDLVVLYRLGPPHCDGHVRDVVSDIGTGGDHRTPKPHTHTRTHARTRAHTHWQHTHSQYTCTSEGTGSPTFISVKEATPAGRTNAKQKHSVIGALRNKHEVSWSHPSGMLCGKMATDCGTVAPCTISREKKVIYNLWSEQGTVRAGHKLKQLDSARQLPVSGI